MTGLPKRGGPRVLDWEKVLAPPPGLADLSQSGGGWELRLVRGVDFGHTPRSGASTYGMAQMVRNWAKKLGYGASVTSTDGSVVVARLWRL